MSTNGTNGHTPVFNKKCDSTGAQNSYLKNLTWQEKDNQFPSSCQAVSRQLYAIFFEEEWSQQLSLIVTFLSKQIAYSQL